MEELDGIINVLREKVWAQAMLFARDITNKPAMTSTEGENSSYGVCFGTAPTPEILRPFGRVEYAQRNVREHKMAPKGEKYLFTRIARSFLSGTVSAIHEDKKNLGNADRAGGRQP